MTKDNLYEWDATADNNSDIGGIGIEGSNLPSNFDNALREVMAQVADRLAAVNGSLASTGSSNAYVVAATGLSYGALTDGIEVAFMANHASTGAATLAVDGLTAKAIRKPDGSALIAGDIASGQFCRLVYDAGNEYWLLHSLPANVGYAGSEAKTAAYTVVVADIGKHLSCDASGGAFTVTLPAAATATGRFVAVVSNTGASNNVTIDPDGSETINNETTLTLEPGASVLIRCDGSEWAAVGVAQATAIARGECELVKDSTNLKLQRVNGNLLTINGSNETIPSAGVTLAPTGLSVSTLYYIYAYMDSGTMTLEASVTADAVDSTTGVAIKTGDATRTHVGWAYPVTGPAFADSETQRYVRSRFNPKPLLIKNAFTAIRTTSSATAAEVNTEIRIEFLAVPGDVLKADAAGYSFNNDVAGVTVSTVGLDGTSTIDPPVGVLSFGQAGDAVTAPAVFDNMSTGYHYITYVGRITGATGTYGFATVGLFNTLSGVIHPAQQ